MNEFIETIATTTVDFSSLSSGNRNQCLRRCIHQTHLGAMKPWTAKYARSANRRSRAPTQAPTRVVNANITETSRRESLQSRLKRNQGTRAVNVASATHPAAATIRTSKPKKIRDRRCSGPSTSKLGPP